MLTRSQLHTDTSSEGYGDILLQKNSDEEQFHPVYYWSSKTSDIEKKYHSYELEILAIVRALQKFRVYLLGLTFKIVTDCEAFKKTDEERNNSQDRTLDINYGRILIIEHRPLN